MEDKSATETSFTEAFDKAVALQDENRPEECIEKAQKLLAEPAIPRYHRMRTLLLLGSTVGDWDEAHEYWENAETLGRIVRRWRPAGEDEAIDVPMRALRVEIDDLKKILDEEKPEWRDVSLDDLNTDDEDTATESGLAEHEERLAEENSRNAAQRVDPDYLATADALSRGLKVDGQATAPDDPIPTVVVPSD
ncbi:hypothetical protein LTR09_001827 [Extremus antarcticus]|uniref:Uncharacterized protein n=1 Tax=Extremus antarcticus TaxID=702011 RepID=A0AAJ0GHK5_9PEZI|nr:hypothetical protein LTR09_001827 [Extremus antarcticus]